MNYRIVLDRTFEKEVKRLAKRYPSLKSDIKALRDEILANPTAGTDLGGGLRKIRMRIASKGKGKSGGARVITFTKKRKSTCFIFTTRRNANRCRLMKSRHCFAKTACEPFFIRTTSAPPD